MRTAFLAAAGCVSLAIPTAAYADQETATGAVTSMAGPALVEQTQSDGSVAHCEYWQGALTTGSRTVVKFTIEGDLAGSPATGLKPTSPSTVPVAKTLEQGYTDGANAVVTISYISSLTDCGALFTNVVQNASLTLKPKPKPKLYQGPLPPPGNTCLDGGKPPRCTVAGCETTSQSVRQTSPPGPTTWDVYTDCSAVRRNERLLSGPRKTSVLNAVYATESGVGPPTAQAVRQCWSGHYHGAWAAVVPNYVPNYCQTGGLPQDPTNKLLGSPVLLHLVSGHWQFRQYIPSVDTPAEARSTGITLPVFFDLIGETQVVHVISHARYNAYRGSTAWNRKPMRARGNSSSGKASA